MEGSITKNVLLCFKKSRTERAFSGSLNFNKRGYLCIAGCQIFQSKHNDSGSGYPSFDRGIEENLEYDVDYKIGYPAQN